MRAPSGTLCTLRTLLLALVPLGLLLFSAAPVVAQDICPAECLDEIDCPRGEICFPPTNTCRPPCEILCIRADPVCGDDGVTYTCGEADANCHGAEVVSEGPCDQDCVCPDVYAPVCGVDGKTYGNACEARCADVEVAHRGVCARHCNDEVDCPAGEICFPPTQTCRRPCEIACFRADPVCGDDGVTYTCGEVDANCHGAEVVHPGECGQCVCPHVFAPVCGADGQTYGNACLAGCAGVDVESQGECQTSCSGNDDCPEGEVCFPPTQACQPQCAVSCFRADPVCGNDGVTYVCGEIDANCHGAIVEHPGPCDGCTEDTDCPQGQSCTSGSCGPCVCPLFFDPVCGVDGETYSNACFAGCARVEIASEGQCTDECKSDANCPVGEVCTEGSCDRCICPRVFDPVCGADGVTYGNACEARCAHVEVVSEGECSDECRNDEDCPVGEVCVADACAPCACPEIFDPVCGVDGTTYGNRCEARCAHVEVDYEGECVPDMCLEDKDEDGVPDVRDNCTRVPNPGQEDVDGKNDDDASLKGIQHYGDACDKDYDDDGIVGPSDFFSLFRPCLGQDLTARPECKEADCDGDGIVGASDFFVGLRPALGTKPGPGVTE